MTEISRRQFLRYGGAAVAIPLTPRVVWWFDKWFGRQRWKATGKTWTAPDGTVLPVGTNWTRKGWEHLCVSPTPDGSEWEVKDKISLDSGWAEQCRKLEEALKKQDPFEDGYSNKDIQALYGGARAGLKFDPRGETYEQVSARLKKVRRAVDQAMEVDARAMDERFARYYLDELGGWVMDEMEPFTNEMYDSAVRKMYQNGEELEFDVTAKDPADQQTADMIKKITKHELKKKYG